MGDVAKECLGGMWATLWESLTQLSLEINGLTICPVSVSVLISLMGY